MMWKTFVAWLSRKLFWCSKLGEICILAALDCDGNDGVFGVNNVNYVLARSSVYDDLAASQIATFLENMPWVERTGTNNYRLRWFTEAREMYARFGRSK